MRQEREKRILRAAEYIVEHRATVRETAKRFGVSKSTIHKDVTERIARLDTPFIWGCVLGVALFPTIVSLETMTITIKLIGPTLSAILGALEPVTAVVISVLLFGEAMTLKIAAGIVLILSAVFLIVWKGKKKIKAKA